MQTGLPRPFERCCTYARRMFRALLGSRPASGQSARPGDRHDQFQDTKIRPARRRPGTRPRARGRDSRPLEQGRTRRARPRPRSCATCLLAQSEQVSTISVRPPGGRRTRYRHCSAACARQAMRLHVTRTVRACRSIASALRRRLASNRALVRKYRNGMGFVIRAG